MMLELNTFTRYVWIKRKLRYNLVYDFEILFMRLRLTLKTPSMLRIWIELIFNNTTKQTYKIRFSLEASWAISIYWWYADYLFLNRMSECCNLSLFKFLFIASTYSSSLQNCSNFFHSYIITNLSLLPTKYPSSNHSIYWKNKERYVFYTHGKILSNRKMDHLKKKKNRSTFQNLFPELIFHDCRMLKFSW